ncbi:hypothetical protein GC173_02980 [bacterium]|nr:hypothetical protein [bacterium]
MTEDWRNRLIPFVLLLLGVFLGLAVDSVDSLPLKFLLVIGISIVLFVAYEFILKAVDLLNFYFVEKYSLFTGIWISAQTPDESLYGVFEMKRKGSNLSIRGKVFDVNSARFVTWWNSRGTVIQTDGHTIFYMYVGPSQAEKDTGHADLNNTYGFCRLRFSGVDENFHTGDGYFIDDRAAVSKVNDSETIERIRRNPVATQLIKVNNQLFKHLGLKQGRIRLSNRAVDEAAISNLVLALHRRRLDLLQAQ